ncbi:MAG: hypothetical protein RL235_343 [Chlamydiota bacterium]
MNSQRVGGIGPQDPKRNTDTIQKQGPGGSRRLEKVEKVSETDPDAQTKSRRKFQDLMHDDIDVEQPRQHASAPSPLEPRFYEENKRKEPQESRRPNEIKKTDAKDVSLPKSRTFWDNADAPPDTPPDTVHVHPKKHATMPSGHSKKETDPEADESFEEQMAKPHDQTAPHHKPITRHRESLALPSTFESDDEEDALPRSQKAKPEALPQEWRTKGHVHGIKEDLESEPSTLPMRPQTEPIEQRHKGATDKEKTIKRKKTSIDEHTADRDRPDQERTFVRTHQNESIVPPAKEPLPARADAIAQVAATQAPPHMSSDTLALYYQMVGTIYVMTQMKPQIVTTEVVLNAASFANSKFYGATITIEKYATAPDSLNIRLSGSNEAVSAFNQNVASLVAAFEGGRFDFRIGRIDAVYRTEDKPVFRRRTKEDRGDHSQGSNR